MSIPGLVIALFIAFSFLLVLALPFMERPAHAGADDKAANFADVERQRERLKLYYERVLRNIHDLDEDHTTGKLNDVEYRAERERWVKRGVAALKAVETLDVQNLIAPPTADVAALDAAIDRALTTSDMMNDTLQPADVTLNAQQTD